MRVVAVLSLCLALMSCTGGERASSGANRSVTTQSAVYCFDDGSRAATRKLKGACQAPERQITESQFAAFVGSQTIPGMTAEPKGDAFYCFYPDGPGADRQMEPCKWMAVRITEADYAAYVGSGEYPYDGLLHPLEQEQFAYCLDPKDGSVRTGFHEFCLPGKERIDREEFVARKKQQMSSPGS